MPLLTTLRRIAFRPFERGGERVENTDAMAATQGMKTDPSDGAPPGYIKADDGRPRH